ncbi:MAG: Tat pathway signal protein, partial [Bacteroidota bacterium]
MNKRKFLKLLGAGGLGLAAPRVAFPSDTLLVPDRAKKMKNWAWMTPELEPSADVWKKRFSIMRRSGIDAIVPEVYDGRHAYYESKRLPVREAWLEKVLPLAKAEGLEFHAWMWAMPCNIEQV